MRVIIQRVSSAKCIVADEIVGQINNGLLLLIGFSKEDTIDILPKMAKKVIGLRIFSDDDDKMNCDLSSIKGDILAISQFTLYADNRRGNRPSFSFAMESDKSKLLYEKFCEMLEVQMMKEIQKGIFGAHMNIDSINDGPVTIILDSHDI